MKILKKDGREQEFNKEKLRTSIYNSSKEADVMLNESDLNILIEDIVDKIGKVRKDNSLTSSYEIIGIVTDVLKKDRFIDALKAYIGFKK